MRILALLLVFQTAMLFGAERVKLKIVDRRDSEQSYSYTIPAKIQSTSNTDVNCSAFPNSANCTGTTNSSGTITPSREVSYSVRGATFTLLLPDNRLVIVNCDSKGLLAGALISATAGGSQPTRNRRSCRKPIVDDIEVEFNKDSAKLFWSVSLDGKTTESETYKIIAIPNR
jgi:hypothetical protein